MQLSDKLVKLRKAKGISQLKLAEMMDISRQAVSRWEVGTAVPSTDNLKFLGRLYDVPLEYLLHDDAPEPVGLDQESGQEKSAKDTKKRNRRIVVLIAAGVIIVVICTMLFGNKAVEEIPMEDIEGSDVVTVDDFEMDFLTQEEVDAVFGTADASPLLDTPTKPNNTKNHRFALSPTYSTTANGKTVKFYYVTATPLTTSSTMHESYNIDIMENGYAKKFVGALVEVYASKITGAIVAAVSVPLSWAPYEMLSYSPNSTARSDYQIRASFTSTARFVWAGYEDDYMYYREGSFHSTSVSEVHTIVSVMNGRTITDTEQKDFTETTEHYTFSEIKDFVKWQYENGSVLVLEKNKFEYYFEYEDGTRVECASQVAPYAADYSYLN